jgi:uncharacterized protein YecT (DUF1311 family)
MRTTTIFILLVATASNAPAAVPDATGQALRNCLSNADQASTADQTDCEVAAERRCAYISLLRKLPPAAASRLKTAQRAWLNRPGFAGGSNS